MNRIYTKVSLYVLAALTSVSFAACSQEDLDNTSNGEVEMRTVTITASEAPVSRTSYTDESNKLSVKWKEGDVIYVGQAVTAGDSDILFSNDGTGFYEFTAETVSDDGKSATFTGELPANLTGTILAVYGKSNSIKVAKNTNNISFPGFDVQNWNNNDKIYDINTITQNNLSEYDFMYAKLDNYNGNTNISFSFKHLGAVLKLNLKGLPANHTIPASGKNVSITAESGTPFRRYIFVSSKGSISYGSTKTNNIYFNNIKSTSTDNNGELVLYRTIIPTEELTGNVTVEVYTAFSETNKPSETYSATIPCSELEAGKFYYADVNLSKVTE